MVHFGIMKDFENVWDFVLLVFLYQILWSELMVYLTESLSDEGEWVSSPL